MRAPNCWSFNATRIVKRYYSAIPDGTIPESKRRFVPTSGEYPQGFKVSGTHVGVKASNTRFPDVALVVSDRPAEVAAVFTKNRFQAAPVQISKARVKQRNGSGFRGVVINAGCANAVTGSGGNEDAVKMVERLDDCIANENQTEVKASSLVMSTGVIGQRLPIDKILAGIPKGYSNLGNNHESWMMAARAICTTDTFPKMSSTSFKLPSSPNTTYRLAGMTKGAGMIHPNMATLLGIMVTDAPIEHIPLQRLLHTAVDKSFNCISVDGDSSTNDSIYLFANGAAGGAPITQSSEQDIDAMSEVLTKFSQELSQLVVRDGEGATKFVRVRVRSCASADEAKKIASSVARSPLVKTALYGKDANWGRILCAVGYTPGVEETAIVPSKTNVSMGLPEDEGTALKLLVNGEPEAVDEAKAAELLKKEDLEILIDLNTGDHGADYWFCDFSHEYVTINGDYRT